MKSILDPTFVYTPSNSTDIRKTFARIRRELMQQQKPLPTRPLFTPIKDPKCQQS